MAYAIKAEIVDPRARTFTFTAHKTMYGGKLIAEGDAVFVMTAGLGRSSVLNSIDKQPTKLSVSPLQRRRSSASVSNTVLIGVVSNFGNRNREQCMPKIDTSSVPSRKGSGYPSPFDEPCAGRTRRRLGNAGGLRDFGVNLMTLPPGGWSSQRHWHSHEDEFVYLLEGELVLIEDGSETVLHPGDCAAFPKGTGNGHHLINRSSAMAVYLEVGSRNPLDLTTCSDIDMMSSNADGRFVHKDGRPYTS